MPPEQSMQDEGLRIERTEVFSGPNVHAPRPLIRLEIALGNLRERTLASLGERFRRNVAALLPGLDEQQELPELFTTTATAVARLVGEIALDLQRHLGAEVRYCRVDTASHPCAVLYEFWDDAVALAAAPLAVELLCGVISASASTTTWHPGDQRERALKRLRPHALDLITMAMVREAVRRGIPWYRLVPRKPFVQLGQGARQKHIRESASCHTSSTGRYLSKDKNATNALLARIGIPVPPQRLVASVEDAIAAAEMLGYPVVTKPLDRGNGKGVSVGLGHPDAVRWGFGEALRYGDQVIVERFVAGEDHRILVIDGRMVAAAKRIPGHVIGDGERTVAQLVELTNADPRRGTEYDQVMVRLEFDAQAEQVLGEAGLTRDSIPAGGQVVPLRRTANVSTGGTCEDVTDRVHPDNRDAAIRASRVLGLNVAGVDFLSTDITRSYRDIGGGICEVNFSPGLRPHWNANPDRDVVGPIVETMFPQGAGSRIPLAAITGGGDVAEACRLLAHMLACNGHRVGTATRDGIRIEGQLVVAGDMTEPNGAATLLFDPSVDAAVMECPAAMIRRQGLAFDTCDVAAILRPSPGRNGKGQKPASPRLDLPPQAGEGTLHEKREHAESRAAAEQVLIQTATRAVVLTADDPQFLALGSMLPAERLVLVNVGAPRDPLGTHIANGGRAVTLSGANKDLALEWHATGKRVQSFRVSDIACFNAPAETGGRALCAAAALAWGLGFEIDRIRSSLRSFRT